MVASCLGALAQGTPPTNPAVIASIHRLLLTDGSYQLISKYEVSGNRVRYISAERGGEWEEVPAKLVDWVATERYASEHTPGARASSQAESDAAAVDKEEADERKNGNGRTPEVTPGLRLPEQDGVWALDYFRNQPELVTLVQNSGDINQRTGHNVLRAAINPLAGTKQQVQLDGERAKVRLHEADPALYISLSGDEEPGPDAMPVETHGAKGPKAESSPASKYAIVRVVSKRNYRVVTGVSISALGRMSQSQDTVETNATILPGGHWMKVTPKGPLTLGEYALMEVLAPGQVNLSVWDFAIDPVAAENANAILPLQRGR